MCMGVRVRVSCVYIHTHQNECAVIHWLLLIEHFFFLLLCYDVSLFSLGNNAYVYELLATSPIHPKEYAFALTDITRDYYLVSQHSRHYSYENSLEDVFTRQYYMHSGQYGGTYTMVVQVCAF